MQEHNPPVRTTRLPVQQAQAVARPGITRIAPNHATRVCYKDRPRDRLFYVENPDFHEPDDQSD